MKNLDVIKNMDELRLNLFNSLQADDVKAQEEAFMNFADGLQNAIMEQAKAEISNQNTAYVDEQILINRGTLKPLTSEEKKYFNAVIERKGLDNVDQAFPKTIIQDIYRYLKEEHPLLSKIDMQNTEVLAQYIVGRPTKAKAFWGKICEDIKQMILDGFDVIDIKSSRLSGFVPVCKGMLELGPDWLANYVITFIQEIMSASLELAIVQGTGKEQPIGMIKKLSGATDSVYPDKDKVTLTDFKPKSLAGIRAGLAKAKTDTGDVVIIVNPMTYCEKVFHNLAYQTVNGTWVLDTLPTGEKIIKTYACPENTLIFGDPKNYFLGVASDVRIDKYTETLAIEDMDLYIAKFYGYGLAKDKNAFFVADVSTVDGATVATLEAHANNTGNNADSIIVKTTQNPGV